MPELEDDDAFVRGLLAELPDPPMPADVVARIEAALSAEAAAEAAATVPAATPTAAAATITPLTEARRSGLGERLRGHWVMSAAAVVAVLALGSAAVVGALDRRTPASSTASGGAASLSTRTPQSTETTLLSASGTDYTKADLRTEVLALVARKTSGSTPPAAAPVAAAARTLVESSDRLAACLARVEEGGPTTAPVAVDAGSFEGQPTLVVVLVGTTASYDVFVVSPACSSADASLLYYASVSG